MKQLPETCPACGSAVIRHKYGWSAAGCGSQIRQSDGFVDQSGECRLRATIATLTAELDAARAEAAEGRRLLQVVVNAASEDDECCVPLRYISSVFAFLANPTPGAALLAEVEALRREHESVGASHLACDDEAIIAAHAEVERLRQETPDA